VNKVLFTLLSKGQNMKNEQIYDLADHAANKAILHIQQHLGQTDGGFAGLYFSGDRWDDLLSILGDYIKAEIDNTTDDYERSYGPQSQAPKG
jgi:hypothetical protein